ncbi:hypothetical protein SBOR_10031 [Sclerotinia borealis F-4128]|uniref:Myb-like domain-containing protein n=1 Tax=Sclerotinia borealis (strain F-4128) TaxID=1432307 RepID=W9BYA7_SCLBF|nr:hypothetical protein SBOR_10031 [Sclerotinia borealis F-4128]
MDGIIIRTAFELRLMSFLNSDAIESLTNPPLLEFPPLHDRNILPASRRSLLLEPNTGTRSRESSSQVSQRSSSIAPFDDDETKYRDGEEVSRVGKAGIGNDTGAIERSLGDTPPQSLRNILDDNTGNARPLHPKKQQRRDNGNNDFVQLPKPPKKQRSNKQVVPPIIIGLHEPPPQAALFPPIASSSFHDSHGRNSLNAVALKATETKEDFESDGAVISMTEGCFDQKKDTKKKKKRKDVKTRNKWSEEETDNLLLGVHKYGVGKWTDILEDPNFTFNNRSGVDLKDRFRTCCPDELRRDNRNSSSHNIGSKANVVGEQLTTGKITLGSSSGNSILGSDQKANGTVSSIASSRLLDAGRKPRSHRKRLTDLQQLGIQGPFKQSKRRERRPFSEQDDHEITQGYSLYGPAWSKIQRDPQFNLQSRQPTDLRDRFRNKHPEKFRSGEDDAARAAFQSKPAHLDDYYLNTSNHSTTNSVTFSLNHELSKVQLPSHPKTSQI